MFLSPQKIVEYCDVHHGMKVADFGSSIGTFTIPIAKRVGVPGTVYAIDVQKDLLSKLHNDAKREGLENIEIILGDFERINGTKLKNESVDRVFVANTFFQVEDKTSCISEISRILKKGGKVIFIDWADSFDGIGPHKESVALEKDIILLFERGHFRKEHNFPAGDHHYGIMFIK